MSKVVLAILLIMLASGCTSGRIADLRDCGKLSVGFGPGLDAEAKFAILVHPSIGIASQTARFGTEDRDCAAVWQERQIVWPLPSLVALMAEAVSGFSKTSDWVLPSFIRGRKSGEQRYTDHSYYTSWFPWLVSPPHDFQRCDPMSFHELTDCEIGGTLGLVSIRAGINPLEILDFLLGFAGLDIAGDDPKKKDADTNKDQSNNTAPQPAAGALRHRNGEAQR